MGEDNIEIKIAQLQFPEIRIKPSELHKVRGYFGEQFREFDLLHNHDLKTGKNIYRYPAIQFKLVDRILSIFSYGNYNIIKFKIENDNDIFISYIPFDIQKKYLYDQEIGFLTEPKAPIDITMMF